ncbi:MAG: TIGR04255 family protein [Oscillospiraceae bacterium]|nr:TIGR04255 family protein [Oscillospiraceae bacterium]
MDKTKRVRYKKSPLIEVIFQLRFPTILKVGANPPEEFQEKIREVYPYYEEAIESVGDVVFANGKPTPISRQNKNYSFTSADENYKINLTPNFIALSTASYTQWEDFRDRITFIVKAFEEVYRPTFYSRVGLRYEDAITKSHLGLEDKKWNELIQPHILGVMTSYDEDKTQSFASAAEFDNGDNTRIKTHFELVRVNGEDEVSFLIDCDYFTLAKIEKGEMMDVANKLHEKSTNFIMSAITEVLHEAMEPEEIKLEQ